MSSGAVARLRGSEDDIGQRLAETRALLARANAATRELPLLEERIATLREDSPYRSTDLKALREQLEQARSARGERARLRIEEATLMRRAEQVRLALSENGIRKITLPLLEHVVIAAPCDENWANMAGDDDVRFCSKCAKNVFNLSMMSQKEAEAVLRAGNDGELCLRFYRRSDGTVLTDDCPVAARRMRFWRRAKTIAAGGLIAAALGLTFAKFLGPQVRKAGTGGSSTLQPG